MGKRAQHKKSASRKAFKASLVNLSVDSRGKARPLSNVCQSDPRRINEETSMYFKEEPKFYGLKELTYLKSPTMLKDIGEHLIEWMHLGVLQLLEGVNLSNYMKFITCFIPFFCLDVRRIKFPGEKKPRLISDMTKSGVNDCCHTLEWPMKVVMNNVKDWTPDTVFMSFDLTKAYLKIEIPELFRRFFGVYLPNFEGSPFGKEVFGVLTGMPFGFKPASFILRHQTDWIIQRLQRKYPWLRHHLWVDDFLFYFDKVYEKDAKAVMSDFDAIVEEAGHVRNKEKSVTDPGQRIMHNGLYFDVVNGHMQLAEVKCIRLLKILEYTSTASDEDILKISIGEWEIYKGIMNYVGYIIPVLSCWLRPWFVFTTTYNKRPPCEELRESASEMLIYIKRNFGSKPLTRKFYRTLRGNWSLWDLKYDDVPIDKEVMIVTVDSSREDTGVYIPQQSVSSEVRVSVSRDDLGNSCANELHGCLYALIRYGKLGGRIVLYNDNSAAVKHINAVRARSRESNSFVKKYVSWLTYSGSAVVAKWVPGVLLHHADDQSRARCLQVTTFYLRGKPLAEKSVFLFDPNNLNECVWVWTDLEPVFRVMCPQYKASELVDRIYALKQDRVGKKLYDKLIPGIFKCYVL